MQTLYHNCRLIDGTGAPAVEQGYLLVEDGMIRSVGAIQDAPDPSTASQCVDLKRRASRAFQLPCAYGPSFSLFLLLCRRIQNTGLPCYGDLSPGHGSAVVRRHYSTGRGRSR